MWCDTHVHGVWDTLVWWNTLVGFGLPWCGEIPLWVLGYPGVGGYPCGVWATLVWWDTLVGFGLPWCGGIPLWGLGYPGVVGYPCGVWATLALSWLPCYEYIVNSLYAACLP